MTKKKRELIEILLDNVKPEDWPEDAKYAAQDKYSAAHGKNKVMFYVCAEPKIIDREPYTYFNGQVLGDPIQLPELCNNWNKTIVHRDEFMKRWDERNPVDDSDGWIQWNGGEMPVEKGTLIDVKYRDGSMTSEVFYTCDNEFRYSRNWCRLYSEKDIIAYRLHVPQEQKTPQQLALEKFGTDWHENEGVQPVDLGIKIDIILGDADLKSNTSARWRWPIVDGCINITKWRIHSDEKETQIDKVELLREPMPPCSEEIPCYFVDEKSPLSTQIGGDHYAKLAIQPMQYSMKNGLDPLQHTIIKYVTRFRDKAGIEDLEKAKHCIDMLIEFEINKK